MDTTDYAALNAHLANTPRTHGRSPVTAVHNVAVQPAWSSALVLWTDEAQPSLSPNGYVFKVSMLDYVPAAEFRYSRTAQRTNDQGFSTTGEFGDVNATYANESAALRAYATRLNDHADGAADMYDLDTDTPRHGSLR